MKPLKSIAFIGNYLPRLCGIATFTHDIHRAVAATCPTLKTSVVAMTDAGGGYDYPPAVTIDVRDDKIEDYIAAAERLNNDGVDVVSLQHEYGIFGGVAGGHIIEFLRRLDMPIVTTLHTILAKPSAAQHAVMARIVDLSTKLIVMSEKGRQFLVSLDAAAAPKIEVVPHGIPDFPFIETSVAKPKFGLQSQSTILTFGLLSPNKGIEVMLDAMPGILESRPNTTYVVLGATHPNLVRKEGETYRNSLMERVRRLGVEEHVIFLNQFVDQATLLNFISMADVYVTPYLNEAQMTSGTLAYSFGLGKAVVSTPYWHAQELLADGLGVLVPFGDVEELGRQVSNLLTNDVRRHSMRKRAYAASRSMTWAETGKRYLSIFESARERPAVHMALASEPSWLARDRDVPAVRTQHFLSLCDDTGMLQHAVYSVADRTHGYCIDDNARALLLSNALAASGESRLTASVSARFAAFIQDAWNPEQRRFRNFMSYDRRWLEDIGSEDSHARTLWALGDCAARDEDLSRRRWAEALFKRALPTVESFSSPRAWAFTLLGLNAYCGARENDRASQLLRRLLTERLVALFDTIESPDWAWFEDSLSYDNARLPQALIQTGLATRNAGYLDIGMRSLRWLMLKQTTSEGCFRPVGTQAFGVRRQTAAFDQQPVEAAATISACLAAWRVEGGAEWRTGAIRAFRWFFGANDLQAVLIDPATGGCADGLHPDRSNENRGAESALSYLLGLVEIRQLERTAAAERRTSAIAERQTSAIAERQTSISTLSHSAGNLSAGLRRIPEAAHLVSIPAPKSAKLAPPA